VALAAAFAALRCRSSPDRNQADTRGPCDTLSWSARRWTAQPGPQGRLPAGPVPAWYRRAGKHWHVGAWCAEVRDV